jgi:hypothetical protein
VVAALGLPPESRVEQRVPKKLLVENGAPTAADKRQIESGIEELFWWAALKPTTIGVPDYRDDVREYVEIAVVSLSLRAEGKAARLNELVHRAVPYPVLLVTEQGASFTLSVAQKRKAQNEEGRVVLDGSVVVAPLVVTPPPYFALAALPKANLYALYQGWQAALESILAAHVTGAPVTPTSPETAAVRREALAAHARLTREIAALRTQAVKEKQTGRRVELNLKVKRLEADLSAAAAALNPEP